MGDFVHRGGVEAVLDGAHVLDGFILDLRKCTKRNYGYLTDFLAVINYKGDRAEKRMRFGTGPCQVARRTANLVFPIYNNMQPSPAPRIRGSDDFLRQHATASAETRVAKGDPIPGHRFTDSWE
jgi:hypothetical protein